MQSKKPKDQNNSDVKEHVIFSAFPKQLEFIQAVLDPQYKFLLYGGAIRGGKTYCTVAIAALFAQAYPGSRWAIVRADRERLKTTVVPTIQKFAQDVDFFGPMNKQNLEIVCANGSVIKLFAESLKEDPELNRFRGLEVNGFFLEEANELSENTFNMCIQRAGAWIIPGIPPEEQPAPKIIMTCNPAKNWVKTLFFDPWKAGKLEPPYFYLPSKQTDNPHLPMAYRESLKHMPARMYDQMVNGNWDLVDSPDQLIQPDWIEDAFNRNPQDVGLTPVKLGVDPARYGDDTTVLCLAKGFYVEEIVAYGSKGTDYTAAEVEKLITKHQIPHHKVVIDSIGVGGGVVDILQSKQFFVTEFIAGSKAINQKMRFDQKIELKFKDLRSESWWLLRELLRTGKIAINPKLDPETKSRLVADLTAPTYDVDNDKTVTVESKKDIKKRIGKSTDYGDALVMAFAQMKPIRDWWDKITSGIVT